MDVFGLCKGHTWVEVDQGDIAERAFPKMVDHTSKEMKFT